MALYSARNASSPHADRNAFSSSSHAGTSASGRNSPPNSPNLPSSDGSRISPVMASRSGLPGRSSVHLPIVRSVALRLVGNCGRTLGRGDEGAQLAGVLAPGRGLDAGDDVDAPGLGLGDGLGHVLGGEPSG